MATITRRVLRMTRHISIDAIREAAASVYDVAVRTPLVPVDLGEHPDGPARLYLKLETLQPIGSFKIRGAYNTIRQLAPDQLAQGVWTVSAGNAAQGVALAARTVGAGCTVMVMDTAPETKLAAIERLGATIVKASYDECWQAVERHGSERMPGFFVHPFDDDRFISGNATIGLELAEDLPDLDAVVAPLGGAGCCRASPRLFAASAPAPRCTRPSRKPRPRSPRRWRRARPATSPAGAHPSWTARADVRCSRRCGPCSPSCWQDRSSCRSSRSRKPCARLPSAAT